MGQTISVSIPRSSQFGSFVEIIGLDDPREPGRVQDGCLRGLFQLRIGDQLSQPSRAPSCPRVREMGVDRYALIESIPWAFNFPSIVHIRPIQFGPHLKFSRIEIFKFAPDRDFPDAVVDIPTGNLSVSMYRAAGPSGPALMAYPTSRGADEVSLGELEYPFFRTPDGNPFYGNFILPRNGHLYVHFGVLSARASIAIDHLNVAAEACDVRLFDAAFLGAFRIGAAEDRQLQQDNTLLEIHTLPEELPVGDVRVWPSTDLTLSAPEDDFTFASSPLFHCSGLWLTAMRFAPGDHKLARIHATDGGGDTLLLTSGKRLKFWLPMPRSSDMTDLAAAPHFAYRDPTLADDPRRADRRSRYYGLRVRGLGSSQEPQAKLDTNGLRIGLITHGDDSRRFEFAAGVPVELGSERVDSQLIPKSNRSLGDARILDVPVKQAVLRVAAMPIQPFSPLQFDTTRVGAELSFVLPSLRIPPGVRATSPRAERLLVDDKGIAESQDYEAVDLRLETTDPTLRESQVLCVADDEGVFPIDGTDWTERFGLFGRTVQLASLEPPGLNVVLDPAPVTVSRRRSPIETQVTQKRWDARDPSERAIFRQLNLAVDYRPVPFIPSDDEQVLVESAILVSRDDLDVPSQIVRQNGIDSLLLVMSSASDGGESAFHRWVDDNQPVPYRRRFLWAVAPTFAILLKEGPRYAFEIAQDELRGDGSAVPGMCFNFSARHPVPPEDLGFDADWADVDRSSPLLWPQSFARAGDRADPSVDDWRGFFFRDMPCEVTLEDDFSGFPVLAGLVRTINERLLLDYAWRDEKGWTWKARTNLPAEGVDFTPAGFDAYLTFRLLTFETSGAASDPLLASGRVLITLERIRDDSDEPFQVAGSFTFDLQNGTLGRLVVELPEGGAIDTDSIPGVERIEIDRFETDLQRLFVAMRLKPDSDLGSYLPVLSPEVQATILIDLVTVPSENSFIITVLLPTEKRTVLFGLFPLSIQAIRAEFRKEAGLEHDVMLVHGRLGLGRDTFASVGCTIRASKREDQAKWQIGVEVDEVSGGLTIGGVGAEVSVRWSNPAISDPGGDLEAGSGAVQTRSFWGTLKLTGLPAISEVTLQVRIGSGGQFPYWAAVARLGNLSIGPATLEELIAVFSENADIIQGGQPVVQAALTDVASDRFGAIFPPDSAEEDFRWLERWEPTRDAGTMACLSGYLHVGSVFAKPPRPPDRLRDATTIARAEGGLLRISSVLVFADVYRVPLTISYENNAERERYLAGFQLPRFSVAADTTVDGGQLVIGFGPRPRFYRISLGWPELIGDSPIERDWSDAVKVVIQGAWPINTYWGGIFFEYEERESSSKLIIGIAIRAGWTVTKKISRGPASGSADIGFAFGGVIQLTYGWGSDGFAPQLLPHRRHTPYLDATRSSAANLPSRLRCGQSQNLARVVEMLQPYAEQQLDLMTESLEDAQLSLYADVWGKASAQFMGVEVANIEIEGKARFHAEGWDPIRLMTASVDFTFTVTVGCVDHSVDAGVDITLIER